MCILHQQHTITRYLNKKSKIDASIELKAVAIILKNSDEKTFEEKLSKWHDKWKAFINERSEKKKL
jgi:hypothetical protein